MNSILKKLTGFVLAVAATISVTAAEEPIFRAVNHGNAAELRYQNVLLAHFPESALLTDPRWKPLLIASAMPLKQEGGVTRMEDGIHYLVRTLSVKEKSLTVRWDFDFSGYPNDSKMEISMPLSPDFSEKILPQMDGVNQLPLPVTIQIGEKDFKLSGSDTGVGSWKVLHTPNPNPQANKGKLRVSYTRGCSIRDSKGFAALVFEEVRPAAPPVQRPATADSLTVQAKRPEAPLSDYRDGTRFFPTGKVNLRGVQFQLDGKGVTLRSEHTTPEKPERAEFTFPQGEKFTAFYLVQTAAWGGQSGAPLVAQCLIRYADGSCAEQPLRCGVELEDWWLPGNLPNAKLAFTFKNSNERTVGAFLCRFANPHPEKEVQCLEMVSAKGYTTPIFFAVAGIRPDDAMTEYLDDQWTRENIFTPGKDWQQCVIPWQNTVKSDSALDFSFLNHKPAGKFGKLKRVGDHFEFSDRPGEKVRFWGTNLAIGGSFPEKDLTAGIAACLAKQGVNLVRLHLYANLPQHICTTGGVKPEMLDRMFFLISECKKNGVYIYFDLNDGMLYDSLLKREKTYPVEERLKYASMFDPELQKAQRILLKILLTTKNPYTGMTLAEDPALAMVEGINEFSTGMRWAGLEPGQSLADKPAYLAELQNMWRQYLKRHQLPDEPMPSALVHSPAQRKFACEIDRNYYLNLQKFVRSLGVTVPMTGTNLGFNPATLKSAEELDFYGDHFYWAHPNFRRDPKTFPADGALEQSFVNHPAGSNFFRSTLTGYPLVHGEYNYCFPNAKRAEGIPVIASTAAYQDWSGMIFYGATGSCDIGDWNRFRTNPGIMIHSQQTDPATWGLSPFAAMLYRRGDVKPAQRNFEFQIPEEYVFDHWDAGRSGIEYERLAYLGLMGRYTMRFTGAGEMNDLTKIFFAEPNQVKCFDKMLALIGDSRQSRSKQVSDTGELTRYVDEAVYVVNSPCSQSVSGRLGNAAKGKLFPADFTFSTAMNYGTIAVTSLDGKPLDQSNRMLLFAVGNAANTGESITNDDTLTQMGKAPVLIEPFKAKISLKGAAPAAVYAVSPSTGERLRKLSLDSKPEWSTFELNGKDPTIYFEIVR